ncbi:sensor histidine kinase [Mediterraneibacter glycyrrhizinilyticus]|uniref:sensor histidine kinase n=1 Tax=Mediterraneibacter glycyrrhizinilyticus TaxID=342942 RepID=UPI0025A3617C|nr:HAMP domain-containing sensor histidine kinase [Mediterraneibacter glycyrrhizinilyticus]MDM8211752.1 HAMP domain-containing sensor histidine kinase [Mediterraneibacter glycyrrhizinilyticus]
MRNRLLYLCRYLPWLALLLVVDAVSALLLWLSEAEAFGALIPLIMLGTVLLFSVTALVLSRVEQKRENAFRAFLNNPDLINEENLIRSVSASDRENVRLLGTVLREKDAVCSRAKASAEDYEEYVEAWAHETKTPLSLLTMVLDNQGDEIPAPAAFKLEYVRSRLQEYISQILYYARLKGGRKDYLFEQVDLNDCIGEVLEDYSLLLKEKNFRITVQVPEFSAFTDRRGMSFLLGQIISNAVKYSDSRKSQPELAISLEQLETEDVLHICDNGVGVKECDFPYIFEKGFTGDPADAGMKATGMGLYLSRKMADDLGLGLEARSQSGKGFEMSIRFPKVE